MGRGMLFDTTERFGLEDEGGGDVSLSCSDDSK